MNLPKNLREAATTAGDGAAIIAATGTVSSPITELLNNALDAGLSVDQGDPRRKDDTPKLTACGVSQSGLFMLTMEGVDLSTTMAADDERDDLFSTSVSSAGMILLNMHMHDVGRASAAGIPRLMTAIERSLTLRVSGIAPVLPRRRLLLITVTEFEESEASYDEMTAYVEGVLKQAYEEIELPDELIATTLTDVFDVRIAVLRSKIHHPASYTQDITIFGDIVRDAVRVYSDAGLSADQVPSIVDKVSQAITAATTGDNGQAASSRAGSTSPGPTAARNIPSERELKATFACGGAMQSALEKFRNRTKLWRASVDAGRVIPNFASENDKLILRTLEVYDKDAAPYKSSAAFLRKRDELNSALLADSYILFSKQTLKVRESAYQLFRSKLAHIRINDQVEKNVRIAVREAELHFVRNSEALRSKLGNWRFDNERYELVNHMRDDATERLQLARLQGSYVPNVRVPIMFAFHTLLLAPFGRDSRMAQTPVEDMKTTFDPDKMKQPSMMRSRPFQRGHGLTFDENRDGYPKESLDKLTKFFDEYGGNEED